MGYCTDCGYDLRAHRLGDTCPECGKVADVIARAPLPRPLPGTIALGVVTLLPLVWITGGGQGNFYTLCAAAAMILVLVGIAIYQQRRFRLGSHVASILLSTGAATIPLLTLGLFVAVFIIGGSSNVAQMAGDGGFDYWELWFHAWPVLLFGNPVCFMIGLAALAAPPYQRRFVTSWALPTAALIAAAAAASIAMVYFPDA